MKNSKNFPFEKARRISKKETESARKAIEKKVGKKRKARKGRPPKIEADKYVPIAIHLHPIYLLVQLNNMVHILPPIMIR